MFFKRLLSVFICILPIFILTACGGGTETAPDCPFTDISWNNTVKDVIAAEGDDFSTYDSVYGGLCYTYPKEYLEHMGTVKYMFDEKEQLMSVAWAYGAESVEELSALYESINESVNEVYGESGYDANGVGNYGNVWYLESGDIILSTMITSENMALQYAYLHPLVSNSEVR